MSEALEAAMGEEAWIAMKRAADMAQKAAAVREVYRDTKSLYRRVGSSLSRAHRTGKKMVSFGKRLRDDIRAGEAAFGLRKKRRTVRRGAKRPPPRKRGPRGTTRSKYPGQKRLVPYTVARRSRAFRKARKVTSKVSSFAKRHFDDYGTITRDHACYLGFETHGSVDRVWNILGEAVTKAILAKIKIFPRSYDEALSFTGYSYDRLSLWYKRVNYPSAADENVEQIISFGPTTTFEGLSALVSASMKGQADADPTVAPNTDTVARFLDHCLIFNSANSDYQRIYIRDIGESVIKLGAVQKIRLQNVTPNDGGGKELDVTGTNPLNGRKYVFNNHRAKIISTVQETHPQYDFFGLITDRGVNPGYQPATEDDPLNHPPAANQVFTNCKESVKIGMKAGGMKHENTSFTMTHKLRTFVERIYYAGFDKGSWGGCTWFAFERNYRQGSGATEDQIIIGFNRELSMSAHCQFKTQKSMLKHYDNTDLGDLATP